MFVQVFRPNLRLTSNRFGVREAERTELQARLRQRDAGHTALPDAQLFPHTPWVGAHDQPKQAMHHTHTPQKSILHDPCMAHITDTHRGRLFCIHPKLQPRSARLETDVAAARKGFLLKRERAPQAADEVHTASLWDHDMSKHTTHTRLHIVRHTLCHRYQSRAGE